MRSHSPRLAPLALATALALALALLAPGTASAAFTRPFERQIIGTCPSPGICAPAEVVPFTRPDGIAVDAEEGLWVGDLGNNSGRPPSPYLLDGFQSSQHENAFLKTLPIEAPEPVEPQGLTPPGSLALDRSSGDFFVASGANASQYVFGTVELEVFGNTGAFLKRCGLFQEPAYVAIDNSTDPSDPSAGSLYVSHAGEGFGPGAVDRLNAACEPVPFTGSAPYIEGNQIVGPGGAPIALDSRGDIFVGTDEYAPSGEFLRSFDGEETPGLGGSHEHGGFGGQIGGVAVDSSVSGHAHVLVSVWRYGGTGGGGSTEGVIDEFDVSSGRFLKQIMEASPGSRLHRASQLVADSHGDLYLVNGNGSGEGFAPVVDVWGPGRFDPTVRLAEASERTEHSALLNGSVNPEAKVNPEESGLTDCHFEYVTEAAFRVTGFSDLTSGGSKECTPKAGEIPIEPEEFHQVHAEINDLTSGTTYRFRLSATTAGALGGTATTAPLAFTALHAPRIESTTAANLSSTFADLRAQISPLGADTTYQFQYLTQVEYADNGDSFEGPHTPTAVPVPPADIGSGGPSGDALASVRQQVGGLQPGTAYRFRVLAESEVGLTEGADATFITLPPPRPGLPDSRAYELLTPPNKGSAEDMFNSHGNLQGNLDRGYPSESGNAFMLYTRAAFGSFSASEHNVYVFSRHRTAPDGSGGGWTDTSLASPALGEQSLSATVFNPFDFSQVGLLDEVGSIASEAGERATSLLGPPGGPYATLQVDSPSHDLSTTIETEIVGASPDLGHVVLESLDHTLCPGAEEQVPGSHTLCESGAGQFQLLNVNSNGQLLSKCGAALGQGGHGPSSGGTRHNAVSADGSRIFFTVPDPSTFPHPPSGPGCWNRASSANAPQLYMRSGATTTRLSKPTEAGVPDPCKAPWTGCGAAIYVGAAADGSKVFFLTTTPLTKDAVELKLADHELYEYDTETATLTRISAGQPGSPGAKSGAGVAIVPAVSANGSAVYFTASGQLTSDAPPTGGAFDLYRYDTATGATAYIATIGLEYPSTALDSPWPEVGYQPEVALRPDANWYTTPDGRYLLFDSTADLTGYSTAPASGGYCSGGESQGAGSACQEVYRYDSLSGTLLCLSCDPSGARPISNSFFGYSAGVNTPAGGPLRAMSNDGSYAFFDSGDPLVPGDGNGTQDVYEWEAGGAGSCASEAGCISLISSGHDSAPSYLLGASPDGSNVFFGTHARLVPADTDTAGDLYDARICTSEDPCIKPPPSHEGECEGDACSHPVPAPSDETPGSLTYHGPGNEHEGVPKPRCAKGKVRSHGRCVKRHHKTTRHKKHKRAASSNRRAGR